MQLSRWQHVLSIFFLIFFSNFEERVSYILLIPYVNSNNFNICRTELREPYSYKYVWVAFRIRLRRQTTKPFRVSINSDRNGQPKNACILEIKSMQLWQTCSTIYSLFVRRVFSPLGLFSPSSFPVRSFSPQSFPPWFFTH